MASRGSGEANPGTDEENQGRPSSESVDNWDDLSLDSTDIEELLRTFSNQPHELRDLEILPFAVDAGIPENAMASTIGGQAATVSPTPTSNRSTSTKRHSAPSKFDDLPMEKDEKGVLEDLARTIVGTHNADDRKSEGIYDQMLRFFNGVDIWPDTPEFQALYIMRNYNSNRAVPAAQAAASAGGNRNCGKEKKERGRYNCARCRVPKRSPRCQCPRKVERRNMFDEDPPVQQRCTRTRAGSCNPDGNRGVRGNDNDRKSRVRGRSFPTEASISKKAKNSDGEKARNAKSKNGKKKGNA